MVKLLSSKFGLSASCVLIPGLTGMALHEAGRWYLPPKGDSKENFLIMRVVMKTNKKKPIINCHKTAGAKIYDFWTRNVTQLPSGNASSLPASISGVQSHGFLPKVTKEPQHLSARQESSSKLFSQENKFLNIY